MPLENVKNSEYMLEEHFPVFTVQCVSYLGADVNDRDCLDRRDISGRLNDVYDESLPFALRYIKRVQAGQGVNSTGVLEVPRVTFKELIANALIHCDYFAFASAFASVRLFVFSDRIEIISPGHLPNNLTIENIKNGNSNMRNPVLASFATKLLPYRGLDSGIRRAVKAYPDLSFEEDKDANWFKAAIKLPANSIGDTES